MKLPTPTSTRDAARSFALVDEITKDVNRLRRIDNPNDIRIVCDALIRHGLAIP